MAFLGIFTSEFFMTTAWRWVINTLFGFVADYGWRVILFTVCLKLLLSPLDFFNRKRSKDTQRAMGRIKPEMDRIEKQYASDQRELMMRKRALQKKHHIGGMGMTCVTTILTMFVFMTLWSGFTSISKDMNVNAYKTLETTFDTAYSQCMNPSDSRSIAANNESYWRFYLNGFTLTSEASEGLAAYTKAYKEEHADQSPSDIELKNELDRLAGVAYESEFKFNFNSTLTDLNYYTSYTYNASTEEVTAPSYDSALYPVFRQAYWIARYAAREDVIEKYDLDVNQDFLWVKNIWRADTWTSPIMSASEYHSLTGESFDTDKYNEVMSGVTSKYGTQWNGYLILVVLTVVLNFLSQWLMQRMQKKSGEAALQGAGGTMKVLMWVMPIMFAFFAIQYASAFTLYMVTNTLMSLVLMGASSLILSWRDKHLDHREANGYIYTPRKFGDKKSTVGTTSSSTPVRSARIAKPIPPKKKR